MPPTNSARPSTTARRLAEAATRLPDVTAGIACAGTPLESRSFISREKAFLFIGTKDARLKLSSSVVEAHALARQSPDAVRVGAGGWATINLAAGALLAAPVLARWVAESYDVCSGGARAAKASRQARTRSKRGRS